MKWKAPLIAHAIGHCMHIWIHNERHIRTSVPESGGSCGACVCLSRCASWTGNKCCMCACCCGYSESLCKLRPQTFAIDNQFDSMGKPRRFNETQVEWGNVPSERTDNDPLPAAHALFARMVGKNSAIIKRCRGVAGNTNVPTRGTAPSATNAIRQVRHSYAIRANGCMCQPGVYHMSVI